MNSHSANSLLISRYPGLIVGAFIAIAVIFAAYVCAEQQVDRAREMRQLSLSLITDLQMSTEGLDRTSRSYLLTGAPGSKQDFQNIINIRDGKRLRLSAAQGAYRVFSPSDSALMQQTGLSNAELGKFVIAKAKADALVREEISATNRLETYIDSTNTAPSKPSNELEGSAHHQAMSELMRSIGELSEMVNKRTLDDIRAAQIIATWLCAIFLLFGLIFLALLWITHQKLRGLWGGSAVELHARVTSITNGSTATSAQNEIRTENVLTLLTNMQSNLARMSEQRKSVEEQILRQSNLYAALSQCSQAIVRCVDENELFSKVCRDVVNFGAMSMAWIGLTELQDKRIKVVASYGDQAELQDAVLSSILTDFPLESALGESAVRENKPVWCQDFLGESKLAPWHKAATEHGWHSFAALPLQRNGCAIGALCLHAAEINAFDQAARNLLEEIALVISFALDNFVQEFARKEAEVALRQSEARYRSMKSGHHADDDSPINIIPHRSLHEKNFNMGADENLGGRLSNQIYPIELDENRPLLLLLVEGVDHTIQMIIDQLRHRQIDYRTKRLEVDAPFRQASPESPDLVIFSFLMSDFNVGTAMGILKEYPDAGIQMIMLSGTVAENVAVTAMKHGELEYVSKEYIGTLSDVVKKILEVARLDENQRTTQEKLASANSYLAKLSAQLIEIQEQERKNLAREMHDELGQRLTLLKISVHRMREFLEDSQGINTWEKIDAEVNGLAAQIRMISGSLRPQTLDYIGLEAAIRQLMDNQFSNSQITCVLEYAGLPSKVAAPMDITIYRIVQECVTNIVKHAQATEVVVEINGDASGLDIEVIVRDNGVGFDTTKIKTMESGTVRSGLLGLRERIGLLGGSFGVESTIGKGTCIVASLSLTGVVNG